MTDVLEPAARPPVSRRSGLLCGVGVATGIALGYLFTFASPSLLKNHALFLDAFSGSTAAAVALGAAAREGSASLTLAVISPLLCIGIYDVFLWWAGRLWGEVLLRHYARTPRMRRLIARGEAWVAKRGFWTLALSYFLPVPNLALYVICGTSGMTLTVFLLGDAVGTLLWTGFLVTLGWQIGPPALKVVDAINHYGLYVTIGLVVVVILLQLRNARGSAGPRSTAAIDESAEGSA